MAHTSDLQDAVLAVVLRQPRAEAGHEAATAQAQQERERRRGHLRPENCSINVPDNMTEGLKGDPA